MHLLIRTNSMGHFSFFRHITSLKICNTRFTVYYIYCRFCCHWFYLMFKINKFYKKVKLIIWILLLWLLWLRPYDYLATTYANLGKTLVLFLWLFCLLVCFFYLQSGATKYVVIFILFSRFWLKPAIQNSIFYQPIFSSCLYLRLTNGVIVVLVFDIGTLSTTYFMFNDGKAVSWGKYSITNPLKEVYRTEVLLLFCVIAEADRIAYIYMHIYTLAPSNFASLWFSSL